MLAIIMNSWKERIRRKELYILLIIGALFMLLFSNGNGSLSINGEPLTGFSNMLMVMHIIINGVVCILAMTLSIGTIPNEYERHTSHLIWIRNISQIKYHTALTIANVLAGIWALLVLYVIMTIYIVTNGHAFLLIHIIPAFLIEIINVMFVTTFVSGLSIIMPVIAVGFIGVLTTLLGILYGVLDLFSSMSDGIGNRFISILLSIVPNLHGIQKQAYHVITGRTVDIHMILVTLFALWFVSLGVLFFRRKEA